MASEAATFQGVPEWFGAAMIGAMIAALGYVAKLGVEEWATWRAARAVRLARLLRLHALLGASGIAFLVQRQHADRLAAMLRANHPECETEREGLDRLFVRLYDQFTSDESDLHAIIRGVTEHTLRPLNQALLQWLLEDLTYRTAGPGDTLGSQLAAKLNQLEAHLLLWLAKYEIWIPAKPLHALVYMADEQSHGVGFPSGIDELVLNVLGRRRGSVGSCAGREGGPQQ